MIKLQTYEQERQAYYSRWILGKVVTSARQVPYTGGKLDLVQGLLKYSIAVHRAYQQVPEDVRRSWGTSKGDHVELFF
ncbi:hypothetical protein D3C77_571890 [compost metagenome]